ncbi:hypothetical protein WOLCODRAFT_166646 [Wolfiporia cocos MD-104 SS10]|uniref:Uncharacterized protein n=1 Tax=Wolfiporia cocos (strain MD-104) TaxID=742152 RepID=A0A2H3J1D1_WOLCO|nr:hypothetical protein WOLCODRAFT_166646 [Wolfiporia cocos MD-104 SS10]
MSLLKLFKSRPAAQRASPSVSPVTAHSPIELYLSEQRNFWKSQFHELLKSGEDHRAAALTRLHSQQYLLSSAHTWDLQTAHDGLIIERDELIELSESPEKLCLEAVSKADKYRKRAQSLHAEVREVVRRSQDGLAAARASGSAPLGPGMSRGGSRVKTHTAYPNDTDIHHDGITPRGMRRRDAAHSPVPELCNSPTDSDLSSGYAYDESASLSASPLESPWEGGRVAGRVSRERSSPVSGSLSQRVLCFQSGSACSACHLPSTSSAIHSWIRDSLASDSYIDSESSYGPVTPRSSPHSAAPSADFSNSPTFIAKLETALSGQGVSAENIIRCPSPDPDHPTPSSPNLSSEARLDRSHPPYLPHGTSRGTSPIPLPFRPMARAQRSVPDLRNVKRRRRSPIFLTEEAAAQFKMLSDTLESPNMVGDVKHDGGESELDDLITDDRTVEAASVVVQPYFGWANSAIYFVAGLFFLNADAKQASTVLT